MKTAICFSGHLRSFETTFNYLKETVINPMNADVFIHTWDIIGSSASRFKGDGFATNYIVDLNKIQKLANPIFFTVEKETDLFVKVTDDIKILEHEKKYIVGHVGFHINMFYSIFKANQLKSEYEKIKNFTYDRVIRFRPDIRMGTLFIPTLFPDNNKIYVPKIGKYSDVGINDQVAIGSSHNIDEYCNIYNNIIEYYKNHVAEARPETLLKYHLIQNKINIQELDITYDIYRFDGTILRQTEFAGTNINVKWK